MNGVPARRRLPATAPLLTGLALLALGLALAAGGAKLLSLGGSAYYLVAGLALVGSGVLLLVGRIEGGWLYAGFLLGTVAWAIGEVGFDGWMLMPRLAAPSVFGLLAAFAVRRLPGWRPARPGMVLAMGLVLAVGAGAALSAMLPPLPADPLYRTGLEPSAPPARMAGPAQGGDWPHYGNDQGGSRFSTLDQITPANVAGLKPAWTFRTGPDRTGTMPMLEVTPLKVGDMLYVCTAYNDVIALDAETGAQRWRFRSGADTSASPYGNCRGVAYYKAPGATGACAERILTGTIDARLVAIDARTGRPCAGFGKGGTVSLLDGMGQVIPGYYFVTSAPAVVRGKVVVGGWIADGQYLGEPSGVIRAFDAVTGRLSWAFDVGRPDRRTLPPPGDQYTRSTPNSWAPMSTDEDLGLVYVPMGNSTPDFYGGRRRPIDDAYGAAIVAIHADTGVEAWKFSTVHHDVWDYDVPSQPTLIDLPVAGGIRKALVQPTKRGETFVLDRATGQPIMPVSERPVPQINAAPGERLSPTQPFSTGMPATGGPDPDERTMWGLTPFDQLWCRIAMREVHFGGQFTAIGLNAPTLVNPSVNGANNWGSIAVDRDRHLMIVPGMRLATWARLISREEAIRRGANRPMGANAHMTYGLNPQLYLPYAIEMRPFVSPLGVPCTSPPYGTLSAVDLATGKLVWTRRLGTATRSGPLGISSHLPFAIGTPLAGGAIATRGGLTFIGASQDRMLRAFETATGREVWSAALPTAGMATPSTYWSDKSGRQFVVIAAGGHKYIESPPGDYIVAFALPKK
jgi:quinoprotein glucose dehydrogenase